MFVILTTAGHLDVVMVSSYTVLLTVVRAQLVVLAYLRDQAQRYMIGGTCHQTELSAGQL